MKVKMITPETKLFFEHLLDPDVYSLISRGEPVTAIGLIEKNIPIGAVAGMLGDNDIFTVMSLYVDPDHRRKGGGKMLMGALEAVLEEAGSGTAVLSYIESSVDEDNTVPPLMEALEIYETSSLEHLYEIPLESFFTSGMFPETFKSKHIKSLSDLNRKEQETFNTQYKALNTNMTGTLFNSFKPDPELSFTSIKEGTVSGYLLFGKDLGPLKVPVVNLSKVRDPRVTGALLSAFIAACRDRFSPDLKFVLPAPDDRYERMLARLRDVKNLQHNYIF